MNAENPTIASTFASWNRSRQWLVAGATFLCLFLVALTFYLLLRPSYKPLFTDLKPADAGAMIAELEKEKIPFRLDEDSGAILVPENSSRAARIKLMSGDLRLQNVVGLELFKDSNLGLTEFAQKVNYQRALQGELSRTIMSLDEIDMARVHLTLPESSIFRRDKARPKASIAVFMRRGQHLGEDTIGGIQRLVAAAIPEMNASDVTVLDARGAAMVSANSGVEDQKLALKQAIEGHYQGKILAQIAHLVGDTHANVAVDADINFDQVQVTRESESRPRSSNTPNLPSLPGILETDESGATPANRPLLPINAGGGKSNRIVEQVVSAPGSIRRLSVGIALDKALSPDETRQVTDLISASIGLDASRGDVISIIARPTLATAGADSGKAALTFPLATTSGAPAAPEPASVHPTTAGTTPVTRNSGSGYSLASGEHPLAWAILLGALVLTAAFLLLRRSPAKSVLRRMSEDERQEFVRRLKKLIDTGEPHGKA